MKAQQGYSMAALEAVPGAQLILLHKVQVKAVVTAKGFEQMTRKQGKTLKLLCSFCCLKSVCLNGTAAM